MDDHDFEALKVASITPQKERWPSPNVSVSILGPTPRVSGSLYWSALHACVDDNRAHYAKTLTSMAAIDADKTLSAVGRASKKAEIAAAAVAALEKSKKLAAARDAVARQVSSWDKQLGLTPEPSDTISDATVRAEIRAHVASLKPGERLAFINDHASEVAAAVLTAPSFLSGLTPAELGVVKARIAQRANSALAQPRQN
jgi:hypothetical protein